MSMVDAFLACRKIMPKWRDMDDSESIFFKFMHVVTGQLDNRPWSERNREGEDNNPIHHCKHLPLGTFTVASGNVLQEIIHLQRPCILRLMVQQAILILLCNLAATQKMASLPSLKLLLASYTCPAKCRSGCDPSATMAIISSTSSNIAPTLFTSK